MKKVRVIGLVAVVIAVAALVFVSLGAARTAKPAAATADKVTLQLK